MNSRSLVTSCFVFALQFAPTGIFSASPAFAGDPLMDRNGRTLDAWVNGVQTTSSKPTPIVDSAGTEAFETSWLATAKKGSLCFKLKTKDARLGAPERIDLLIHEIRNDRPNQQWRNYQTKPGTSESVAAFTSEKGFCPEEYFLTERLRFPELPPGDYVVRFSYWGVGNWDRQDMILTITE